MADKNKKKPVGDERLLVIVEAQVNQGVGFCDSKLSKERERVIKYYNSTLPARQSEGRSSYVSTDVYDSTEAMKSQLLETFSGNPDNLVSFPAQGPEDVSGSRAATEYATYQIHRLNPGYDIFAHAIHDGLTARVGITKVYWEEDHEDIEETFEDTPETDVRAIASREDVTDLDADETEIGSGIYHGKLTRRIDRSRVCLTPVPPEEFIITRSATSIQNARMISHRTLKGKDELIKEGYDKKKVETINWSDSRTLDLTGEKLERENAVSDQTGKEDENFQPEVEKVMFYETYIRMAMEEGGTVKLWKVCHAGRVLLDKEEVDRAPFMAFIPLPIPHVFHGNNFAARVIPTQNARTVLTRGILDHTSVTTNPRWGVVKGGLMNPKEMLDNRLGGIVNMNRPDAVKPLEQQALNPFVFQVLEMLKMNKEESTGISALSQGLNKDAISTQNSAALVDNLVTLSQQRQKIIARNFAFGYLVPLYLEVYRLCLENDKTQRMIEVAGEHTPISVEGWVERKDCKVALHLGYGERDMQAKKLADARQFILADPAIGHMFTPQNRFALVMDTFRAAQLENAAAYLTSPEKAGPPPENPEAKLKQKELELKDAELKTKIPVEQIKAQVATTKGQADITKAQMSLEEARTTKPKEQLDMALALREADRMDADTANTIDVSQREVKMLEEAPPEATNAIVSPNS